MSIRRMKARASGGAGVDAQLERLRRYASDQGWEIVGENSDRAASRDAGGRPGLVHLLEIADSLPKQFDILLVECPSRLSRDVVELTHIRRRLELAGIELRTMNEPHCQASGTLAQRISSLFDVYSNLARSEAVRNRRLAAARAGQWLDPAPLAKSRVRKRGQ